MSATERPPLLSDIEALSLEVEKARPVAMTLVALEAYAQSVDMPGAEMERHADAIREMGPKRLKRLRKSLHAAAELAELLDLTESIEQTEEASPSPEIFEPVEPTMSNTPVEPGMTEAELLADTPEPMPDEPAPETPEGISSPEASRTDLSESGKEWVLKLVPNYDFEDKRNHREKTARQVAGELYRMMGEPKTRMTGGKQIDPLARIRQRLRGMSNADIASQDGVSSQAVNQWFKAFVGKRFSTSPEDIVTTDGANDGSELETTSQDSVEVDIAIDAVPAVVRTDPRPVPSLLDVRARSSALGELSISLADTKPFAEYWAKEMKLDSDDTELLIQVLDPGYSFELTGSHRSKLHHFRQFIEKNLPKLEDSDLDLTTNEIARLVRLLGRTGSNGERAFTAKPQSAREVSMHDGYLVPQQRGELFSALEKLYVYMQTHKGTEKGETVVSQFEEALRHAGFSDEQITGLEATIGLRDAESLEPSDANDAVKVLQGLFVDNIKKLDEDEDRELIASLRMLTNMAMGRKTVRDVYHRLHGKDSTVTYESVTRLLESGIIKLAM
jgi:hypothetical protein